MIGVFSSIGDPVLIDRAGQKGEGLPSCPFECELGSHFHPGYVFEGPPIMPDGRISQVRFEALAFRP